MQRNRKLLWTLALAGCLGTAPAAHAEFIVDIPDVVIDVTSNSVFLDGVFSNGFADPTAVDVPIMMTVTDPGGLTPISFQLGVAVGDGGTVLGGTDDPANLPRLVDNFSGPQNIFIDYVTGTAVEQPGNPGVPRPLSFATNPATSLFVATSWIDFSFNGVNYPQGEQLLMTVRFDVTGAEQNVTHFFGVDPPGMPGSTFWTDPSGTEFPTTLTNGTVTVQGVIIPEPASVSMAAFSALMVGGWFGWKRRRK